MTKPSSLINDREREICRRVKDVRWQSRSTQAEFARMFRLTRAQLAAIETGCTPLRYALGREICETFDVCQNWLATGADPVFGYEALPPEIEAEIPKRALFSEAHEYHFGHYIQQQISSAEMQVAMAGLVGVMSQAKQKVAENYALQLQRCWFEKLTPPEQAKLFGLLMETAANYLRLRERERSASQASALPDSVKKALTSAREVWLSDGQMNDVASLLEDLLQDVRKATEGPQNRGAKAALARHLGVPRQAITNWLRGVAMPRGEMVLRLQQWLASRKRKEES